VRDHGPGLTRDERISAFERFWRSPRHQNVSGTGLGLAIARTLLETGGARLELHDAGPGLAADIVLPAATAV
jgi:signal transduction histidine kinase